ncbi:hypothetical protein MKX01_025978 [Papaver californicum]|nr:hypothetical protein MKX01_025978 [Papaver californicum]
MSNSDKKQALFMILQALYEGPYMKAAHKLEQESGIYFSMKYFENELRHGHWEEVEDYLLGFTELTSNRYSIKLFFEIRKQRYLEALDRKETEKAIDLLVKDLKVFKTFDEKVYSDMTGLLGLENFRENEHLTMYVDENSARATLFDAAKELIQANPLFKDKLDFPTLEESWLQSLIKQSLIRQKHPPQQENLMSNPFSLRPVPPQQNLMSNPFALRLVPAGYEYRNLQNNGGVPLFGNYQNSENAWLKLAKAADDEVNIIHINELKEQGHCRSLHLPDKLKCNKISRLMYANSGSILALASNAMHLLWKWKKTEASASVIPEIWEPKSGKLMLNDIKNVTNEETEPCFAMSKNGLYLISTSGGQISVFNTSTFESMSTFMPPPPVCTCIIFYPEDNNILIIGTEDSKIMIYDIRQDEVNETLKGHLKKITGLAYSKELKVLVSLDADAQICVWKWDTWVKQNTALQIPAGRNSASAIRLQYQKDQIHFLVVHQIHLAIYETTNLKHVKQWVVPKSSAHITDATLSCDSEMVFASFHDATILVFNVVNLQPLCRIQPSAYLPAISSNLGVYPIVIDAHPTKNQFALGLSDGGVYVIEPLNSCGTSVVPAVNNVSDPSADLS